MNEEDEVDERFEWFHELAKLPAEELIQQATDLNRAMFRKFVVASLPDHVPLENQSPAEFAATVLELRANERGWNRALGSALIDATTHDPKETCWRRFRTCDPLLALALGRLIGISRRSRQTISKTPGVPVTFPLHRDQKA
jgi:hypothetical protein